MDESFDDPEGIFKSGQVEEGIEQVKPEPPPPEFVAAIEPTVPSDSEVQEPLCQLKMMLHLKNQTPEYFVTTALFKSKQSVAVKAVGTRLLETMGDYSPELSNKLVLWITDCKPKPSKDTCLNKLTAYYGQFTPLSNLDYLSEQNEVKKRIVTTRRILLEEMFNIVDFSSEGVISYIDLTNAINHIELVLTSEELDFIVYTCFQKHENVRKLDYTLL